MTVSRSGYRALMAVLVVATACLALVDHHSWSGPVLLNLTAGHGVHATDPLVLGLAGLCLALLARSSSAPALTPATV